MKGKNKLKFFSIGMITIGIVMIWFGSYCM